MQANKNGLAAGQKLKLESHLSLNLKRKIRDMQTEITSKQDEVDALKRNIKNTKIAEIEVEMKMYMDECTRLRHQLEEVIKSKDTFADPEELKVIEEKFQQQEMLINTMKNENNELALAYQRKEDDNRKLAEIIQANERKIKKAASLVKESNKAKRAMKGLDRESAKNKQEIVNLRN